MSATMRIVTAYALALAVAGCSGKVTGKNGGGGNDSGAAGAGASGGAGGADGGSNTGTTDGGAGSGGGAGHGNAGSGGGAGSGNAGSGGAGSGGSGTVSIFVAQGHKGRLTISCDDGHTWIADRNDDDTVHCFDTSAHDCDHDPGAARGLAHGNGYFLATFGWGTPGYIARSKNGVDWEKFPLTATYADLAFGHGVFVANDHTPAISSDGMTWKPGGTTALSVYNVRAIEFTPKSGGRFVVTGETGSNHDLVISKDDAKSWVHPTTLPPECGGAVNGIASSDSIVVVAQAGGRICSSADGGDTWVTTKPASGFTSPPVWTGSEFMVWQTSTVYRSKDAVAWTSAAITPSTVHIGQVAVNKHGTFVAVNGDWDTWYDKQAFYRSQDGVTWEVLPKTAFKGSHPIYFMEAGDVEASATCPMP